MVQTNDIVLIYYEDEPLVFARLEDIAPDIKKGWYHVKLLILQIPLQTTTWILRENYIQGDEFTMGGKKMRLERVRCPEGPEGTQKKSDTHGAATGKKIISFADLKKE